MLIYKRTALIFYIYIYKEECLFVCLFAMRLDTVRANALKLSRNLHHTQGKVDINYFSGKNHPLTCYRQLIKLTNRIAAFQKLRIIDSEGGRRPFERSFTTIYTFYQYYACYRQPTELTNRIAAF